MDDAVVAMLNALSEGLGGSTDDLLNSPAKYNDGLWKAALTINDVGVKPVAAVVLAIMIVLMLASHASRIEGDRELGVKIIASTLFKAALVIIAVRESVPLPRRDQRNRHLHLRRRQQGQRRRSLAAMR